MPRIHDRLEIPDAELAFATARSSGPGGQNVNKVETRVTLLFDVDASPSLSDEQKDRLRRRLATRISKHGVLRVVSQRHRTQAANRRAATERFVALVGEALRRRKRRRPTRPGARARARRLEDKRHRGRVKAGRRRPTADDRWRGATPPAARSPTWPPSSWSTPAPTSSAPTFRCRRRSSTRPGARSPRSTASPPSSSG